MHKYLLRLFLMANCLIFSSIVMAKDHIHGSLEANFEIAKKFPMPSPWLLSAQCSACHGTMGTVSNELIPPLAGMDKQAFIDRMQNYKTKDSDEFVVMGIVSQPLTNEEINAMADFFSKLPPLPLNPKKPKKDIILPDWAVMKKDAG